MLSFEVQLQLLIPFLPQQVLSEGRLIPAPTLPEPCYWSSILTVDPVKRGRDPPLVRRCWA